VVVGQRRRRERDDLCPSRLAGSMVNTMTRRIHTELS
jgi:hypothetical protein